MRTLNSRWGPKRSSQCPRALTFQLFCLLFFVSNASAQGLAKEFIYSGGRLVAVEMTASTNDPGSIFVEYWTGIAGTAVSDLTGNGAYPNSPTGTTHFTSFEAPTNWANSYGRRLRGYVVPPETGYYTFYIASDDASELWLSTDHDPANAAKIAYLTTYTTYRNWTANASQESAAIYLVGGRQYYIEALHKENAGGDHLSVAWDPPSTALEVIPGDHLVPFEE